MEKLELYKIFQNWSTTVKVNHKYSLSFTESSIIYNFGLTMINLNEKLIPNEIISFFDNCVYFLRKNQKGGY